MRIRRRLVHPKPLVAFRPALRPSVTTPALLDLPGQHPPRRRPRAVAALERRYTYTPRRILIAFAILAAAFVLAMAWTFVSAPDTSGPYAGAGPGQAGGLDTQRRPGR